MKYILLLLFIPCIALGQIPRTLKIQDRGFAIDLGNDVIRDSSIHVYNLCPFKHKFPSYLKFRDTLSTDTAMRWPIHEEMFFTIMRAPNVPDIDNNFIGIGDNLGGGHYFIQGNNITYSRFETNFMNDSTDSYLESASIHCNYNLGFSLSRKKNSAIHKNTSPQKQPTHAKQLYYYMWITGNNWDGWTGGEDVIWLNSPPVEGEINKYKCCDHHILIIKKFSSMADEKKWHLENKNMLDVIFDQYMQSYNTKPTQRSHPLQP